MVVFGGSGFVGQHVCEQALRLGASRVTSVSRKGRPPNLENTPWADSITWFKGDMFDPDKAWKHVLEGEGTKPSGIVSTLGGFGSNDFMYKICGQANIDLIDAAADADIPRFAFISVHDYKFPGGWHAQDYLMKGYFQGKRDAEARLLERYPQGGVALRPGFIYGSRPLGKRSIPLQLLGAPLAMLMKVLPAKTLSDIPIAGAAFVPPVSVDSVGKAAATAVLDSNIPSGFMDVFTIQRF